MWMRRNGLRTTTVVTGVLAAWTLAVPVFAVDVVDDPVQFDERAAQIIQTSNSLCWEMHRFHQPEPDYRQSYRMAKEIWSRAGELREALRAGPVETEVLTRQMSELNEIFTQVEKSLSKWQDGDRSLVAPDARPGQRTVVVPGDEVDIPFVGGFRVGGPRVVVTDDGRPPLERRRLHPNSHGSKRCLERELAAVKVAISYMLEDAGVAAPPNSPAVDAPATTGAVAVPPAPASRLVDPQKIASPSTKKPASASTTTKSP